MVAVGRGLFEDLHGEDFDVGEGSVGGACFGFFDFGYHVHAFGDFAEHGVLAVEVGRAAYGGVGFALFGGELDVADFFFGLFNDFLLEFVQSGLVALFLKFAHVVLAFGDNAVEDGLELSHFELLLYLFGFGGGVGLAGDDVELRAGTFARG